MRAPLLSKPDQMNPRQTIWSASNQREQHHSDEVLFDLLRLASNLGQNLNPCSPNANDIVQSNAVLHQQLVKLIANNNNNNSNQHNQHQQHQDASLQFQSAHLPMAPTYQTSTIQPTSNNYQMHNQEPSPINLRVKQDSQPNRHLDDNRKPPTSQHQAAMPIQQCTPLDLSLNTHGPASKLTNQMRLSYARRSTTTAAANTRRRSTGHQSDLAISLVPKVQITSSTSPSASTCSAGSTGSVASSIASPSMEDGNQNSGSINKYQTDLRSLSADHLLSDAAASLSLPASPLGGNQIIKSTIRPIKRSTGSRKNRQGAIAIRRPSSTHSDKDSPSDSDGLTKVLKAHLCLQCGRSFSRSDMLTRHSRLHSGLKPYQCGKCQQVFSRSDHLSTHERTHTGEKPYQCEQCNYSACRRDMITRHMRTHAMKTTTTTATTDSVTDKRLIIKVDCYEGRDYVDGSTTSSDLSMQQTDTDLKYNCSDRGSSGSGSPNLTQYGNMIGRTPSI